MLISIQNRSMYAFYPYVKNYKQILIWYFSGSKSAEKPKRNVYHQHVLRIQTEINLLMCFISSCDKKTRQKTKPRQRSNQEEDVLNKDDYVTLYAWCEAGETRNRITKRTSRNTNQTNLLNCLNPTSTNTLSIQKCAQRMPANQSTTPHL